MLYNAAFLFAKYQTFTIVSHLDIIIITDYVIMERLIIGCNLAYF